MMILMQITVICSSEVGPKNTAERMVRRRVQIMQTPRHSPATVGNCRATVTPRAV